MISHNEKCIFIHIPKTGGESITSLFNDNNIKIGKHATAQQLRAYLDEKAWSEYFKFSFVRNPWDLVVSMYFHLRKPLYVEQYRDMLLHPTRACAYACRHTFKEYCKAIFIDRMFQDEEERAEWPVYHFAPQLEWLTASNGVLDIDYVGKFENLSNDLSMAFKVIGKQFTLLPRLNHSSHQHYSYYYDDDTIEIVAAHYAKDIEAFSYTFRHQE